MRNFNGDACVLFILPTESLIQMFHPAKHGLIHRTSLNKHKTRGHIPDLLIMTTLNDCSLIPRVNQIRTDGLC